MSSTEIQGALLKALDELQAQHAAQVRMLQHEQKQQYKHFSTLLDALTTRLDDLTEQLQYNATQTGSTASQVRDLTGQLNGLGSLLERLNSRLKP